MYNLSFLATTLKKILRVATVGQRLRVHLNTTYFTENWKLKTIKNNNNKVTVHWPIRTVHVTWIVQEALVQKKNKKGNAGARRKRRKPKRSLNLNKMYSFVIYLRFALMPLWFEQYWAACRNCIPVIWLFLITTTNDNVQGNLIIKNFMCN